MEANSPAQHPYAGEFTIWSSECPDGSPLARCAGWHKLGQELCTYQRVLMHKSSQLACSLSAWGRRLSGWPQTGPTSCPERQGLAVAATKRKAQVVLSGRAQSLKVHPPRLLTSLDPVPQIPKGRSEQLTHAPWLTPPATSPRPEPPNLGAPCPLPWRSFHPRHQLTPRQLLLSALLC